MRWLICLLLGHDEANYVGNSRLKGLHLKWCRCGALSDHLGVWRGASWIGWTDDEEEGNPDGS